jgi:hypothetical protein
MEMLAKERGMPDGMSRDKHPMQKHPYRTPRKVKTRVPDTLQLGAILPCSAFLASRKINKLRVFNTREYSDSPCLFHQSSLQALRSRPLFMSHRFSEERSRVNIYAERGVANE